MNININLHKSSSIPSTMHKIINRLTLTYLIGIIPFAILNFSEGNMLIASLISIICFVLTYININISRKKEYNHYLVFVILLPIVYFLLYQNIVVKGFIGVLWCFPTIVIFNFILSQRLAVIANALILLTITPTMLDQFEISLMVRIYTCLIIVGALANLFVHIISEQQSNLHKLIITDPLTGLLNRLTLEDELTLAIEQHARVQTKMTLVSLDIDHFKLINDTHGHDVGDQVLIQISTLLKQHSRLVDKVYRLGGEEFLILLFNTDLQAAHSFATSIQNLLRKHNFDHQLNPTLSIGLAEVDDEKTWEEWLKHADKNLYVAKDEGRNTIIS